MLNNPRTKIPEQKSRIISNKNTTQPPPCLGVSVRNWAANCFKYNYVRTDYREGQNNEGLDFSGS